MEGECISDMSQGVIHFLHCGFGSIYARRTFFLLSPFHNVSHSNISHIHIDVNESRHIYIYLDSLTSINMNVGNVRMTYIVKRRK